MIKQKLDKMKDAVEDIFPLRPFILSFAFLLLALISYILFTLTVSGAKHERIELSGRVMGEIHLEEPVVEPVVEKIEPSPLHEEETVTQISPEPLPNPHDQLPTETMSIENSIAGLSEETAYGSLPIIRKSDGLTPFKAYQTPFTAKESSKSVISLVMSDFGLSDTLSKSMIDTLPENITFVASPYAENLQAKVLAARTKSFEIWMGIPLQGNNLNIGPNTLLAGLNTKENLTRLNTHLGKATGYAGIVIDAEAKFPEDSQDLQNIVNAISARGLAVSQLSPNDKIISGSVAKSNSPFAQSKLWIDTTLTKEFILASLAEAEKMSLESGTAVAAFNPSPFTAAIIQEWQKSLPAKNIQLAPLSYSAKMNLSSSAADIKPNETP